MTQTDPWHRVTRGNPCRVCGKPDWCTFQGGTACCMRVESPVPAKNGGWIHRDPTLRPPPPTARPDEQPTIDAPALVAGWQRATGVWTRRECADRLGVADFSLEALGACWAHEHRAWAFPMQDGQGNIVGVRLRAMDGRKWAVRGSRQGIFVPAVVPQHVALITEGPTDTAAAITLGFFALGRPSCNTGGLQIMAAARRLGVRRVVMVADNDDPGLQGAARVAGEIGLPHTTFLSPAKDLRAFLLSGGTREMVEAEIGNRVWRK